MALEKSNAVKKVMSTLHTDGGDVIKNSKLILNEQHRFYEKLYTSNPYIQFQMEADPPRKISDARKNELDSVLTLEELGVALATTARNKTPGPDGITADFYKVFYIKLKHILLAAFNDSFRVKRIFQSGREGIISLLPKKGETLEW